MLTLFGLSLPLPSDKLVELPLGWVWVWPNKLLLMPESVWTPPAPPSLAGVGPGSSLLVSLGYIAVSVTLRWSASTADCCYSLGCRAETDSSCVLCTVLNCTVHSSSPHRLTVQHQLKPVQYNNTIQHNNFLFEILPFTLSGLACFYLVKLVLVLHI